MENSYWIIFIILLFVILHNEKQQYIIRKIIGKKKGRGKEMLTLAKNFIGKKCLFYTFNNQITGTIKEVTENGILIEEKNELQIINPDYVVRIREYPKNKKGKDKSVILD